MTGGASAQFAAVPLNLAHQNSTVNYFVTGTWSEKAYQEAKLLCDNVNIVTQVDHKHESQSISSQWNLQKGAAYTYYCDNETIHGIEFPQIPDVDESLYGPLVCDMSSNLFSRPVDVSRFGLIYACAQKNFGASGVTIVIVRKDLLGKGRIGVPSMMAYKTCENTPPTYNIYISNLIVEWMLNQGGLTVMHERAVTRCELLYKYISSSKFYKNFVDDKFKSRMNVTFRIKATGADSKRNEELESLFCKEGEARGLLGLAGHRSVGGMRASIYNAMSVQGVEALVQFMKEFEAKHSK